MKNKKFFLGMLAIALVFGMTVVGCGGDDSTDGWTDDWTDDGGNVGDPALTGTVSITGTAQVGQTLTANTGSLGGSGTISYQWKRAGTTNIGTNSSTYVVQTADVGSTIVVTVTRAGYSGSVTSTATAAVIPALPQPGDTASNPIDRIEDINLGTMTDAGSGWRQLLDAINTAGKYVNLDLSACTMTGTSFNPDFSVTTGKNRIVSLVLPAAATSIEAGNSSNSTFKNFTSLTSVSGANITAIGDYAFNGDTLTSSSNRNLQSVDFPKATTIGTWAFYYCTNLESVNLPLATSIGERAFQQCTSLQSVDFPQVTSIGDSAFRSCKSLQSVSFPQVTTIGNSVFYDTGNTALVITMGATAPTLGYRIFYLINEPKTVTVKVPTGATGYGTGVSGTDTTANWANGLRGGGWDGTTWVVSGPSTGGVDQINQSISLIIQQQ